MDLMVADLTPVSSSMIAAAGYDAETQRLTIQFNNGAEYSYGGVPEAEFNALLSAQSVGRYFIDNIKNLYRVE